MKKFSCLVVTLFALATVAYAQRVPAKFDEFTDKPAVNYYPYSEITLADRIDRYKKALQLDRSATPYIIYYKSRMYDEGSRYAMESWFATPGQELRDIRRFAERESVPQVFGGYREENTIEFWIVPKGAGPPQPWPTVDPADIITCPGIAVYPSAESSERSRPVTFTVKLYTETKISPAYEWSVSTGEIVAGKGGDSVDVDVSKTTADRVTATVRVNGLPAPCRQGAVATIKLGPQASLIDYFEQFNHSEMSARVDNLMIQVNNNPTCKAYVIVYSSRKGPLSGVNTGLIMIRKNFAFRKYSYDNVVLIDGGSREFPTVEMWLVPPGATPPRPKPYVDSRFVKRSKPPRGGNHHN